MKEALTVIGIIVIAIILGSAIWYTHNNGPRSTPIPTPTITPTTTPTSTPIPTRMPTATVTAKIIVTARGGLLLVNGTVTNNGPNTAYNVGLHVIAPANPALYPFEETQDVTVPISSGTYEVGATYSLSTLTPHLTATINITIVPTSSLQQLILDNATATIIWSNMP